VPNNISLVKREILGSDRDFFIIKGSSMKPLLDDGCIVKIGLVNPCDLKIGDIAVFLRDGRDTVTCHRIIFIFKRNGDVTYLEKGDNASHIGLISSHNVIGKAYYAIKEGNIIELNHKKYLKRVFFIAICTIFSLYKIFAGSVKNVLFSKKRIKIITLFGNIARRSFLFLSGKFL